MKVMTSLFQGSCPDLASCPPTVLPEFALIGRSNVGKSSLVNMLTRSQGLAKVSQIPGKTQLINFFTINGAWNLVDLPGYGFAKVGKAERGGFSTMVADYLQNRSGLVGTFVLIDTRLAPQALDLEFLRWMVGCGLAFILVFTKTDSLSKTVVQKNIGVFLSAMVGITEEPPTYVLCSAKEGEGRREILALIDSALSEISGS